MLNEAEVIIKFSQLILQLPENAFDDHYPRHPNLSLNCDGPFEVFYAPLDYVNTSAEITIVGLTPGKHRMCRSLVIAKLMRSLYGRSARLGPVKNPSAPSARAARVDHFNQRFCLSN
jgi:hypothetical protein